MPMTQLVVQLMLISLLVVVGCKNNIKPVQLETWPAVSALLL